MEMQKAFFKALVCVTFLVTFIDKNSAMHHRKRVSIREENAIDLYEFYTSNCDKIYHLYNNNNTYVKSICHLHEFINFPLARKECESLNLKLYVIKTEEDEEALVKHENSIHEKANEMSFWIYGKKNERGKWYAKKQFLNIVLKGENGQCLMLSNKMGAFKKYANNCTTPMSAICELELSKVIRDLLKIYPSTGIKKEIPLIEE
ncbi:hypothetical protein PVAND_000910 [Polypedilum vanderplanki]|uniref:C-type lectin domain-containing protein n=1 Tax=Polypedilum vanderplanki TaxID=319348 RepID=A0A9J6BMN1_POLVA|nr:hypothetical protein PVAND_000910 [Polypedilum vanderplanki]